MVRKRRINRELARYSNSDLHLLLTQVEEELARRGLDSAPAEHQLDRSATRTLQPWQEPTPVILRVDVPIGASEQDRINAALEVQKNHIVKEFETSYTWIEEIWKSIQAINCVLFFIRGIVLTANTATKDPAKRGEIIRTMLQTKIDDKDIDAHLVGMIKHNFNVAEEYHETVLHDAKEAFLPVLADFGEAMSLVRSKRDNGEALLALAADGGLTSYLDVTKVIGKLGRKKGATPVAAYILKEAVRLKKLHNYRTDGETMKGLIKELAKREDVQCWKAALEEWKQIPLHEEEKRRLKEPKIDRQSIEVQAHAQLDRYGGNLIALGDYLKDLRRNERARGGS